ncbi:hypothetical protein [Streptomyces sp. NPDC001380]|uniref:hypothetical protein n=1 Tax=Streptomyces sp. NPDC001380 TaxID=3364566 RepID=UPI0036BCA308
MKDDRLNHAGHPGAFASVTAPPGAEAHCRERRTDHGDRHASARRGLFSRMPGQLHHCLQHRKPSDEHTALPTGLAAAA